MNIETPKKQESLNFNQIVYRYIEQGSKLENKYKESIESVRKGFFDYLKVSSIDELMKKLNDPKELPIGIYDKRYFKSPYEVDIISGFGGKDARIIVFDPFSKGEEKVFPDNISEIIDVTDKHRRNEVVGMVWRSGGIQKTYYKDDKPHNGLWVHESERGSGLGYGIYRLHEEIFGKQQSEVTSTLSLLKAYLRLGFKPEKALNPISGDMLNYNINEVIESYFKESKEQLDFPIYLKREVNRTDPKI